MTFRPLLAVLISLTACFSDKPDLTATGPGSSGDATDGDGPGQTATSAPTTGTDPTTSTTSTTTGDTTTAPPPTTTEPPLDTTTTATTVSTTTGDTTGECLDLTAPAMPEALPGTTTDGGPCNDPEGQPLDAPCTDPSGCGCASGRCFVVPALGGFCSECLADDHCAEGGCTVPNPIQGIGARCNIGAPGDGCQTGAICNFSCAQRCSPILEVPGIITAATCSECLSDADCGPARPNCTPVYAVSDFSGQLVCMPDASVPDNEGCSLQGDGDKACASGHCGEASVMGLLKLGICGECNADADCPQGQQCTDPQVDLDNGLLIGSECL
jgi:hypothetical protein